MIERLELIVVGAGPCGIAVGAAAKRAGVPCALFDKGCVTNSLIGYPYYMTFFSTAVLLEVGGVPFTIPEPKPTRREALAYYRKVVDFWRLDVRQYEEVIAVEGSEGDFTVRTRRRDGSEGVHEAATVVVATGGFDRANALDVPGEALSKVRHEYREPYPYWDSDVLVVGGGNSAVEAALELHRNGARVSMVHFQDALDRIKPWVLPDITNRVEKGEIPMYWRHRVAEIRPSSVMLKSEESGRTTELANDFVLALTGWHADHTLLIEMGVAIDEATGIPEHDPATMQTNVAGVYLAGVIAAGHDANKIFIENGREHGELIVAHRLARESGQPATPARAPRAHPAAPGPRRA
jgi:thioredoxin reductase (NADPH)